MCDIIASYTIIVNSELFPSTTTNRLNPVTYSLLNPIMTHSCLYQIENLVLIGGLSGQ